MKDPKYTPPKDESWAKYVFYRTEIGSTAHGTGLPGHEDYDEIGIMGEPWEQVVGISKGEDTIVYRPGRGPGDRSEPGDYDLTIHTARKWARLCATGNPSMLVALHGPQRFWNQDVPLPPFGAFWSKQAIARFIGYATQQRERLEGVRGGKHTNRPELVEAHGYDTKYAMHMVRLGFQGIEFMSTGELKFPIQGEVGDYLRAIRRGEVSYEEVLETARKNEVLLKQFHEDPKIPTNPNFRDINLWLRAVQEWADTV